MLTLLDLIGLALLVLLLNHWWRSRDAKACALVYAAQRCQELDLQLLDQSIVLHKLRLKRSDGGMLQWWREYRFEFSSTGQDRYPGSLTMSGYRLLSIELAAHVTYIH
ncbi:DUF3301 domain-containing protein [Gammaproteobacteria bacterium LSUCC0112]|nr:DUF3301 domain-containing protein [Gammaproteobacteria bacterium LSUCC0112]